MIATPLAQLAAVIVAVLALVLTHYGLVRGSLAKWAEATHQLRQDHDQLERRVDVHLQAPQHGAVSLVSREMCTQIHSAQQELWAERFDRIDERLRSIERLMRTQAEGGEHG